MEDFPEMTWTGQKFDLGLREAASSPIAWTAKPRFKWAAAAYGQFSPT